MASRENLRKNLKLARKQAGRPKRGESVPSAKVKTWLEPDHLEHVQRHGGSPYVRQLILADIAAGAKPVSGPRLQVGRIMMEVTLSLEVKTRVMALGGSAYVRHLVEWSHRLPDSIVVTLHK